jgi:hypothetical protein
MRNDFEDQWIDLYSVQDIEDVSSLTIDEMGHFIVAYSDGSEESLGVIHSMCHIIVYGIGDDVLFEDFILKGERITLPTFDEPGYRLIAWSEDIDVITCDTIIQAVYEPIEQLIVLAIPSLDTEITDNLDYGETYTFPTVNR